MRVTASVGPVRSRVWPVPPDALAVLREMFTVEVPGAFFARRRTPWWDGKVRFFGADGRFYTGLLPRVVEVLEAHDHTVKYDDERAKPAGAVLRGVWKYVGPAPRDYQSRIAADAPEVARAVVKSATNSGKTEIAILITSKISVRTLFITPTVDLAEQTRARFAAALPGAKVGLLTGTGSTVKIDSSDNADVVVANVQGLAFRVRERIEGKERGPRGGKKWKFGPIHAEGKAFLRSFGLLFADEVHLLSSLEWSKLISACPAYYRFALSATPETGDPSRDLLLTGLFGEVVGEVGQRELAERGISARVTVKLIRYAPARSLGALPWDEQKRQGIVEARERNDAIAKVVATEAAAGMRVMVLVEEYAHAGQIGERLDRAGTGWAFMSGANRPERARTMADFRSGKVKVAIMTRIGNVGIDVKEIDRLVVASGGLKKSTAVQKAGRLVRSRPDKKEAVLYDCLDHGVYEKGVPKAKRFLERHFEQRVAAYEGEGFDVEALR